MTASLVTGGAGFLGSHVASACLELGHDVVVFDDLSGGHARNVPSGATFVQGDVSSEGDVTALFAAHRFDYVYHLAAYAAEGLSHFIRRFNYTNNVIGSVNLVNAAVNHDVRCLVFTSSIAVYGEARPPMTEDLIPRPVDPYGIAKYAIELDLAAAHQLFGLDSVIFRPHNVYGERQNLSDRYRNVIGIFMNQAMSGRPMTMFGDGTQTRAFTHVDDVAPAIARSVHVPGAYNQVFNVGADQPHTVAELAAIVAEAFGLPLEVVQLPQRDEVIHAFSSHDRARVVLGASASISLAEGIDRMARWARSVGAQPQSRFGEIEIRRNLPSAWVDERDIRHP